MIKSSFYSFETAKRAIMNSQLGLDVTGNNVANVNTAGYTRQRVDQVSFGISGSRSKYQLYNGAMPGQGSAVTGIAQVRDPYLDNRYRAEYASVGEYAVKSDILNELTNIFNEIDEIGLWSEMQNLIDTMNIWMGSANNAEIGIAVQAVAKRVAAMLNANSTQLNNLLTASFEDLQSTVNDINSLLQQISEVNVTIREEEIYGSPALELRDYRNVLIDELSQYIDITVEYKPEQVTNGKVVEQCNITIKGLNHTLVSGSKYNAFEVEPSGTGAAQDLLNGGLVAIKLVDGVSRLEIGGNCDLTQHFYNGILQGQLSGFVNAINGEGAYASNALGNDFRGIQYYRNALNDFAQLFTDTLNSLNVVDHGTRVNHVLSDINDIKAEIDALAALEPDRTDPDLADQVTKWDNDMKALKDEMTEQLERLGTYTKVVNSTNTAVYDPSDPAFDIDAFLTELDANGLTIQSFEMYHYGVLLDEINALEQQKQALAAGGLGVGDAEYDAISIQQKVLAEQMVQYGTVENGSNAQFDPNNPLYDPLNYNYSGIHLSAPNFASGHYQVIDTAGNVDTAVVDDFVQKYIASPLAKDQPLFCFGYRDDGTAILPGDADFDLQTAAREIVITREWQDNVNWLNASSDFPIRGTENPSDHNDNLLKMYDALLNGSYTFGTGYRHTFKDFSLSLMEDTGTDTAQNKTLLAASTSIWSGINTQRESVSAVSSDEEAINMMIYQNYYNAAARYMTTLDEALNTIINGMGVVGR